MLQLFLEMIILLVNKKSHEARTSRGLGAALIVLQSYFKPFFFLIYSIATGLLYFSHS